MSRVIAAEWVPDSYIYWPRRQRPVPDKSTTLVAIAGGRIYHNYAMDLMLSARNWFRPTEHVHTLILEGEEGWPNGTATRYRTLLEAMPDSHYVFLIDADMRIDGPVGPEILPGEFGITATLHPGYVGKVWAELPYEKRTESAAYVAPGEGGTYFCGGFVGGERLAMKLLAATIEGMLRHDRDREMMPVWHDESCLNAALALAPPERVLSPSYCYPDRDDYYKQVVWQEEYPRIITAIDKEPAERVGR